MTHNKSDLSLNDQDFKSDSKGLPKQRIRTSCF